MVNALIMQALKDKPGTSRLSHQPTPNCALLNFAGFADKPYFVDLAPSQTRFSSASLFLMYTGPS